MIVGTGDVAMHARPILFWQDLEHCHRHALFTHSLACEAFIVTNYHPDATGSQWLCCRQNASELDKRHQASMFEVIGILWCQYRFWEVCADNSEVLLAKHSFQFDLVIAGVFSYGWHADTKFYGIVFPYSTAANACVVREMARLNISQCHWDFWAWSCWCLASHKSWVQGLCPCIVPVKIPHVFDGVAICWDHWASRKKTHVRAKGSESLFVCPSSSYERHLQFQNLGFQERCRKGIWKQENPWPQKPHLRVCERMFRLESIFSEVLSTAQLFHHLFSVKSS